MLRRANPRGLQQIASLLEWQQSRLLGGVLQAQQHEQQRGAASKVSADKSVQYARQRAAFEDSLSGLRKQWAKQRLDALARKAAQEEEERAKREAAKAQRAQQDAAAKERRMQQLRERQAAERELRAQAKVERLKRHTLRQEVLDVAREDRRKRLLAASKNWITADTLDMRIKEALDNPVPLSLGAEQPRLDAAA